MPFGEKFDWTLIIEYRSMTFASHSEAHRCIGATQNDLNKIERRWCLWQSPKANCHCPEPSFSSMRDTIPPVIARSRRRRSNLNIFAEGKRTRPGPGKRTIVFRHCEERKFLSLRGTQRRSNPFTQGSLKWGRLKNWVYWKKQCFQLLEPRGVDPGREC